MIYVVIQFSCIVYLLINAQFEHLGTLNYALFSVAMIIGILAVRNMRPDNLTILPSLKDQHRLVTHGLYRFIRHPMYTSVLLLCLALTLTHVHILSLLVLLVLWIDLVLKSSVEEQLLSARFSAYKNYQQKTGRFLPF